MKVSLKKKACVRNTMNIRQNRKIQFKIVYACYAQERVINRDIWHFDYVLNFGSVLNLRVKRI